VYADSISLLANLVTLALMLRRRFVLAGLAGSLAILVRQTNVVWLALVCLAAWMDDPEVRAAPRPLAAWLHRAWTALLGIAGFARSCCGTAAWPSAAAGRSRPASTPATSSCSWSSIS
jgi:hypothetical protein